jgi:glucose/arabinose dehydrogenase
MTNDIRTANRLIWRYKLLTTLLILFCATGLVNGSAKISGEIGLSPDLAAPSDSKSVVNFSTVVGWPEGQTPAPPEGFVVHRFADGLISPRWPYVLPNGDVLIAESSTVIKREMPKEFEEGLRRAGNVMKNANRITLLRDADGDGKPEVHRVFLKDLNQPFGMTLVGDHLYVANTDALLRFPYKPGQTGIEVPGQKVIDLPAGGYNNHWTRNVIASRDGRKLYVSVGSATNVDEEGIDVKDGRRAAILEINPDGTGLRVFADGLRNPNGMDWAPGTHALWTVVNERDELGDKLVPDYMTRVQEGAFYGWPYLYFSQHVDSRHAGERPDLVGKAIPPDYALGAHTASLGLQFYTGKMFPKHYWGDAFVAQHGSWNRSQLAGYKVLTVPFKDGEPAGPPEDFLTGFIADEDKGEVYGRPVGLAVMNDGSLLVTDDAAGVVWRVAPIEGTVRQDSVIDGFLRPESALQIDDGRIYVSEVGEIDKPGDGGIALVTPNGERRSYVGGLDDPKGLAWWGGWLYVADVQGVWRIDRYGHAVLLAGVKDFPTKPMRLNDLAVTQDGTLYVSDTGDREQGGGTVFKIDQSGKVEHVFPDGQHPDIHNPNGLFVEDNNVLLIVDFVTGGLYRVDLASGKTTSIAGGLGAADGIVKTADGHLYVSDWQGGKVFRVGRNGEVQRLGTAEKFESAADIRLTNDGNYLMVPDMKAGKLVFLSLILLANPIYYYHTAGRSRAAKRERRVLAVGVAAHQFARRTQLIAAAVMRCWRGVLAKPM